jgi:hypothetical protein
MKLNLTLLVIAVVCASANAISNGVNEEVWTDSSTCEGEPTRVTTFTDGCFKRGTNNFQKWVSIDSNTIKRQRYGSFGCDGAVTSTAFTVTEVGKCHKNAGNDHYSFKMTWGAAKATGTKTTHVFRRDWTGGACDAAGKLYQIMDFGAIDECHRQGNESSIKWTKGGEGIDAEVTEKTYGTADCTGTPTSTLKFSIVKNSCSTSQQCYGTGNNQYCESIATKYRMGEASATSSGTALSTVVASANILVAILSVLSILML